MLSPLSACREEGFYYYIQTIEGLQYSVHKRRRVPPTAGPPTGHSKFSPISRHLCLTDAYSRIWMYSMTALSSLAAMDDDCCRGLSWLAGLTCCEEDISLCK